MQQSFQSSPGLVTGRYPSTGAAAASRSTFQSSPGLVTGRYNQQIQNQLYDEHVSILARSGDRALPARQILNHNETVEFQSSPGLVTGRYGFSS